MADVRKLRVAAETKPKPNADIAALLKKLGDLNEAGELDGLIVVMDSKDAFDWVWVWEDLAAGIGIVEACQSSMLWELVDA